MKAPVSVEVTVPQEKWEQFEEIMDARGVAATLLRGHESGWRYLVILNDQYQNTLDLLSGLQRTSFITKYFTN